MKPKNELTYLKTFIQLTEDQAIKRDMLETFLEDRDKTLLIDADSFMYNTAYYNESEELDLNARYSDFLQQIQSIGNIIEAEGFNIVDIIYFFTTANNNFRHEIYPEYKGNRSDDNIRTEARRIMYYSIGALQNSNCKVWYSDTLEADDGCSNVAKTMDVNSYIVLNKDKDVDQINGAHFDYYKEKTGEFDELGKEIKQYRGLKYVTPQESYDMFLLQMLLGDSVDNIKGAANIGKTKAPEHLEGKTNFSKLLTVARAYRVYEKRSKVGTWSNCTRLQHNNHKGEKRMVNDMKRMRLNVKLMRL